MLDFLSGFFDGLVEILVFGLQNGAVYSLVGLGIALVYKATRILNFAQGELGTVPAFVAWWLLAGFPMGAFDAATASSNLLLLIVATLVAVLVGAALGVGMNVLVVRRLASAAPVTSLVATVGITLLLTSMQIIVFEPKRRNFPRFISGGLDLPGINIVVPWHTFLTIAVLAGVAVLLAVFFRTTMGIALLATAQEPFAAELQGVPVDRMRTLAWGAAGALGGLAGVLGVMFFEGVGPGTVTSFFLVPAFTGVVLGGITSMTGAVVGCLILGVTAQAATKLVSVFDWSVPGPPQVAIFVVLLAVLVIRPRGLMGSAA